MRGAILGVPHNKDKKNSGSMVGFPCFGNWRNFGIYLMYSNVTNPRRIIMCNSLKVSGCGLRWVFAAMTTLGLQAEGVINC